MTIDAYVYPSPNNYRVLMTLELLGLEYNLHALDLHKGEHFKENFVKLCPASLTPTIKDGDKVLSQSVNIIQYLIETYDTEGEYSISKTSPDYWKYNEYIFAHSTGLSVYQDKIFGLGFFKPDQTGAIAFFRDLVNKQIPLIEKQLADNGTGYLFSDHLTIADLITFAHFQASKRAGIELDKYENINAWRAKIGQEPWVKAAFTKLPPPGH